MLFVWQQFASLDFQRPFVFLVGMAAFLFLTAMWAAMSRWHWFWRALAVWAAFVPLLPIRAWEPAWMFALVVPVVIAVLGCVKWLRDRGDLQSERSMRWRFTLRDLLLLVLIVALWMPVVLEVTRAWRPRNWLGWFTSSAALALVAILAFARARSQRWPMSVVDWLQLGFECWLGLLLISMFQNSVTAFLVTYFVIAAIAVGMTLYGWWRWRQTAAALLLLGLIPPIGQAVLSAGYWMRYEGPIGSSSFTTAAKIGIIDLFALELAWALIVLLLLVAARRSGEVARLRRAARARILVRAILCGWAILVCWTYVEMLILPPVPAVAKFTAPINHYERIMAIAERAIVLSPSYGSIAVLSPSYESISSIRPTTPKAADELEALCQELMQLLDEPNYVPYDPGKPSDYGWLCNHWHAAQMLPHRLEAESIAWGENKRPDDAADYALAIVRLGDMQCRGALEADFNIGTWTRRRGLRHLVALRDKLSPDAARKVIAALQRSIDGREDPEVGWARWRWYRQNFWGGWALNLERIVAERQERSEFANQTFVPERRQELAKRLLQADIAVRLFEQEHGRIPNSLSELVPDYLAAVPVDFNSRPLALRIDSDGFMIHCVGWGGLEDAGRFLNWTSYPEQDGFGIDLDYLRGMQF